MEQYESVGLDKEQMLVEMFGHCSVYLVNTKKINWSYSACDCNPPDVVLPNKCLVGKYLRTIIYYVVE